MPKRSHGGEDMAGIMPPPLISPGFIVPRLGVGTSGRWRSWAAARSDDRAGGVGAASGLM